MAERTDLAQWILDLAQKERRLGETATTAEAQDSHRERVLNFTAIGCALEALTQKGVASERVEYRVFEDFGEFWRIVRIPGTEETAEGGEYTESLANARRAARIAETYAEVPVYIEKRTVVESDWETIHG